jgi:uncharacterized protein (TIGR03437 family)
LKNTTLAFLFLFSVRALSAQSTYTISTIAGNGTTGFSGDAGAAAAAQLASPVGLALDKSGNLYIADQVNHRIREVTTDGNITTIAGNGTGGYAGDNAKATSAELNHPLGVAVDGSGNVYVADADNHLIRKFTIGGNISTVAGSTAFGAGYSGDKGTATNAQLNQPCGVALDSSGNLYIADTGNHCIRKVTGTTITTFAGQCSFSGGSGDGGPATLARLSSPRAVAVDASNNVYIADTGNNRIRKVSSGSISAVAGTGLAAFGGDGQSALNAQLFGPRSIAVDASGNIYIADYTNSRVRMISPTGIITTIAGNGRFAYTGDGGAGTSAALNFPSGVTADASGNVFVADTQNNVVRELAAPSTPGGASAPPSIQSVQSAGAFGAFSNTAPGSWIEIFGANLAVNTRSWGSSDFVGINAPTSLDRSSVTIGGVSAFISYISPGQINAQVPSTVGTGPQPVTVTTAAGTSAAFTIQVNLMAPGLLAPSSFNIGGKQYAVALFLDGITYVLPTGALAGVPSRPAKPGETIVLYGIGFGRVSNNLPAGQIVQQANSLINSFQVSFGGTPAALGYWGLAPDSVGLYQFNAVVPSIGASDAVPLTFTLDNSAGTQTLYLAIGN